MGRNKNWTTEETRYLEEQWGQRSAKAIARTLGRPIDGVISKAARMQLGGVRNSGTLVPTNRIICAIYGEGAGSQVTNRLIRLGLPFKSKQIRSCRTRMTDMEEFWKWAEEHKRDLNFKCFEEYELGPEPEWAREKRRMDKQTARTTGRKNHNDPWTPADDRKLQRLIDTGRYTLNDLAKEFQRSEGAVLRRITTARIRGRPKKELRRMWTAEEAEVLLQMVEAGCDWRSIGEAIGRSQKQCEGKYERLCNPQYMKQENRGRGDYVGIKELKPKEVRENLAIINAGADGFLEAPERTNNGS